MSVIGIDPSVDHTCLAEWPSGRTWRTKSGGEGAARLAEISRLMVRFALDSAPDDLEAVFIERTRGKFPKDGLLMACGVIQATLVIALEERFPHPVSVFELSTGTWKKRALGNGAAKKHEVQAWAADFVEGLTEDEADALAIACAGFNMLRDGTTP